MDQQSSARIRFLSTLVAKGGLSLNLGSKSTGFGGIRADIDREAHPEVLANALSLPFRNGTFEQVLFTDVIEHLPPGTEGDALREIWRALKPGGRLLLSTPNRRLFFMLADPAWYVGHRHYTMSEILSLLSSSGFEIERTFTRGYVMDAIAVLFFANRWTSNLCPTWLQKRVSGEYAQNRDDGYTLIVEARRARGGPGQLPDTATRT